MIIAELFMLDKTIKDRNIPDINEYLHNYIVWMNIHDAQNVGFVQFATSMVLKAFRSTTQVIEKEVATCPNSGELVIEHTFPSGKIPITNTPFTADRNDWRGFFTGKKEGTTDPNGRAVISDCEPGVEYLIKFYPDYDGTSEAAINEEYVDIIAKIAALLKSQWDTKLHTEWINFKNHYNSISAQDKFYEYVKQNVNAFWDTLVSLWDMISSIASCVVNNWDNILATVTFNLGGAFYLHHKYGDSIKQFTKQLIDHLKQQKKSHIERIFFLLVDKSLLYVIFSAVINWIFLLPPDLLCAFISRGIAEIVVNIVIGVIISGGTGLAARITAQAASVAKEAVAVKGFISELSTVEKLTTYIGSFSEEIGNIIAKSMLRYTKVTKPAIINSSHSSTAKAIATGKKAVTEENIAKETSQSVNQIETKNITEIKAERTRKMAEKEVNEPPETPNRQHSPEAKVCTTDNCPVSMVTGEELLSLDDGELRGLLPFMWKRLYRTSAAEIDIGLGYGWSHCLAHQLIFKQDKVLWVNNENLTIELPLPTKETPIGVNNLAEAVIYQGNDESEIILAQAHGQGFYHFKRTNSGIQLEYISDKHNNRIVINRDGQGQIHRIHNTAGRGLLIRYEDNHIVGVDYQREIQSTNQDKIWQTIQPLVTYCYNEKHQLIQATNAINESENYYYDELNVIQERKMAGGAAFYWQWEGQGKAVRCLRHWANFKQVDTRYTWGDNGEVTLTRKDGSQQVYQHDKNAKLIKEIAPDGGEVTKDYDPKGRIIAEKNPLGAETFYQYDYQGNLRIVVDPSGEITQYGYDLGRVDSVSKGNATWRCAYNEQGEIAWQADPQEQITYYEYTTTGKIKLIKYPDGSQHELTWNHLGQLIEETLPEGGTLRYRYDSLGRQIIRQDEYGKITRLEYDDIDRLIKIIRSNGTSNTFEYNAYNHITKVTDELGRVTLYEYLPNLDVISRKINPDGSEVNYQYNNIQLNLTDIINETGQHYHIDYYPNGLVSQEIAFDGLITGYEYDLAGHLISKTEYDKQGKAYITTYQRTNTGKLLQKTLPDGKKINYQYNPAGKLLTVDDGNWPITYEYDLSGRITAEHQGWATLRYQYSPLGILSQCKLPDGNIIDYKHTKGGQLKQVDLNGKTLTEHIYKVTQEVARKQGELTSIYDYDDQGRLKSHFISNQHETLYKRLYQYNSVGNLEQIDDSLKGKRQYLYDPLDRLINVRGDISENLIHDPAGNLLSQEHNIHQVNIQGNRLLMQGDKHFSYDDFGCLTAERRGHNQQLVTYYQYDSQHQLQTVNLPDGTIAKYQYDAFGRRIRKMVMDKTGATTKTDYIWQGSKIIAESSKYHYQSYLYEPGTFKPLALLKGKGKNTEVYYYQLDHLGTPQELTQGDGHICWSACYKAYGNLATLAVAEITNPLRFQGQYYDQETGLHYNRYRYYNPDIGRYITPDPIKLAGGLNSYQYTKNPVTEIDPLGLDSVCPLRIAIKDNEIPPNISRAKFEAKVIDFRDNVSSSNYAKWKNGLKNEGLEEEHIREIFYRGSLEKNKNIFETTSGNGWGQYYAEISGTTHPGLPLHAHHLVEKIGGGVAGSQNRIILEEVGINPQLDRINFTWAPMNIKGQHGGMIQEVLNGRLKAVRGNREGIEKVLRDWAVECQNRGK